MYLYHRVLATVASEYVLLPGRPCSFIIVFTDNCTCLFFSIASKDLNDDFSVSKASFIRMSLMWDRVELSILCFHL